MRSSKLGLLLGVVALLAGGTLMAFGFGRTSQGALPPTPTPSAVSASPSKTAASCTGDPWGCGNGAALTAAAALVAKQPGHLNVVVKDRLTGQVWQAGESDYKIWASSTPKLALATALLEEDRAKTITLSSTDRSNISAMLHVSDNNAATNLWNKYAKADPDAMMARFNTVYGMAGAYYADPNVAHHHWGFVKCTASDLAALMSYILDQLDVTDRTYILGQMQAVGTVQHWGVWAAGGTLKPGVKDGWSPELDNGKCHWNTSTVGFAGKDQRYIVAAMYAQNPGGDTITKGVHALSDIIATIFGAPVPATVSVPPSESCGA